MSIVLYYVYILEHTPEYIYIYIYIYLAVGAEHWHVRLNQAWPANVSAATAVADTAAGGVVGAVTVSSALIFYLFLVPPERPPAIDRAFNASKDVKRMKKIDTRVNITWNTACSPASTLMGVFCLLWHRRRGGGGRMGIRRGASPIQCRRASCYAYLRQ